MNLWKFVEHCRQCAQVQLFLSHGAVKNFFIVLCWNVAAYKVLQGGTAVKRNNTCWTALDRLFIQTGFIFFNIHKNKA